MTWTRRQTFGLLGLLLMASSAGTSCRLMTTADQIADVMLETKRYDSPTTYKCRKGERDFDYICYAHIVPISVDAPHGRKGRKIEDRKLGVTVSNIQSPIWFLLGKPLYEATELPLEDSHTP
jgi:hypothetical protein